MTEDIAEFVFGDGVKPPILRKAHNIQRWGDPYGGGWQHWPAGMMERMNYALNVYEVCQDWKRTPMEKQGEWQQVNQAAWEHIIAPLMARELDNQWLDNQ